jgi:hypothetical protein
VTRHTGKFGKKRNAYRILVAKPIENMIAVELNLNLGIFMGFSATIYK